MLGGLSFFQFPTFLLTKTPKEGNWVQNKIPSFGNSALANTIWEMEANWSLLWFEILLLWQSIEHFPTSIMPRDDITVIAPLPSSMNANEVLQNRPSIYVYVLGHLWLLNYRFSANSFLPWIASSLGCGNFKSSKSFQLKYTVLCDKSCLLASCNFKLDLLFLEKRSGFIIKQR